jgi:hypothetical protein
MAGHDDLGALLVEERHVEVDVQEHHLPPEIRLPDGAHAPRGLDPCIPKQNRQCPPVTTPQRQTTEAAADPGAAWNNRRKGLTMEKTGSNENTQLCSMDGCGDAGKAAHVFYRGGALRLVAG